MTKHPKAPITGDPARVREVLLGVVERQLADGTLREVGGTLIRLCFLGYSRDEAIRLIAIALTIDLHEMMLQSRAYDEARYVRQAACPAGAGRREGDGRQAPVAMRAQAHDFRDKVSFD